MKTRTCLIESLFRSEAIEKEMKLSIAAPLIEIFSQEDAPLSVPATSLLVAVALVTCQFECFLRRMANGARKGRWVHLFVIMMKTLLMATLCHRGWLLTETIGDLPSAMWILLFTCSKRLVEVRGSTNHSGRTAMDTSFRRGWLVSNVSSVARLLFAEWCILKQLCFEALGDLTVSIGQFHYQILTFFSSMHVRLLH